MEERFLGVVLPDIEFEDPYFMIVDEEYGWFKGPTEELVLTHWKNRVQTVLTSKLIAERRIKEAETEGHYVCTECFSITAQPVLHVAWHSRT